MNNICKLSALGAVLAASLALAASGTALAGPLSAAATQRAAHHTGLGPPPPPPPPFYLASGTVNVGGLDTNTSFCYNPSPAPTSIANDPVNPACTPPPADPSAVNPFDVPTPYPGWGTPLTAASPPTTSQWVGPQANGKDNQEATPAWYVYDAEFQGCAKISGKVMADNEVGVFLNGVWLADSSATSPHSFRRPPLTFAGTTTSPANVVDFVVRDITRPATGIDYLIKVTPIRCTWTVKHGGNFKSASKKAVLTDTPSHFAVTCSATTLAGHLPSGTNLPGNPLGTINPWTFGGCTSALGAATLAAGALPYNLNTAIYNPSTQVTSGTITGIHLTLSATGCSAVVDGTGATANDGQVDFTYSNTSHVLTVLPSGGNLHYWGVSGCAGLISSGDPATLSAAYTLGPPPSITSP